MPGGWWVLQDERGKPVEGIELARFAYQANTWSKPRVEAQATVTDRRTQARLTAHTYSALIPAVRITLPHNAISLCM